MSRGWQGVPLAEITRLAEALHLQERRTLEQLRIPRATFYHWYDRYLSGRPTLPV